MKSLKEHILEGILDIEDNININSSDITKDVIEKFLKENYSIIGSYTISSDDNEFLVNVKGNIRVKNKDITSLTNEFFEFGVVRGYFDCTKCDSLKSLKGAPKEVGNYFDCSRCELLTSLEGAPKEVGGSFYCLDCYLLKSLKGAPEKIKGNFDCSGCKSLKSLEGTPKEVRGFFNCSYCDNLISLEGAPQKVGGDFYCTNCVIHFKKYDVEKYTKVTKNIYV